MRVALDSNIFIYALQRNEEFYRATLSLLKAIESGKMTGVASRLVYAEVLSDSALTSHDIRVIDAYLPATGVVFEPMDMAVLARAASLRRSHHRLKMPDAIHLATAHIGGAECFVTNDRELTGLHINGPEIISIADAAKRLGLEL
jgi:predicted nucleic acid-binding protein